MKRTPARSSRSAAAFTLIELLVVIVIIAILAGIALPVFSRINERATVIEDANNLRQLGIAMQAYINDNDDFAPEAASWAQGSGGGGGGGATTQGLYNTYVESFEVFKSPFDARPGGDSTTFPISYGMNANMAGTGTNTARWSKLSNLVVLVPNPDTAVEGEVTWTDNTLTVTRAGIPENGGTHAKGRRINVLFADAHVEDTTLASLKLGETDKPPFWNVDGSN